MMLYYHLREKSGSRVAENLSPLKTRIPYTPVQMEKGVGAYFYKYNEN